MERILEEVPYHVFSYQGDSFVAHRGLKRPLKISQEAKSYLERRAAGEQASPENEGLSRVNSLSQRMRNLIDCYDCDMRLRGQNWNSPCQRSAISRVDIAIAGHVAMKCQIKVG